MAYRQKHKRPTRFDYDLIVIGSGSGGGVAATASARKGKKVAIIEAGAIGGECPNFGCVPTKSLLGAAEAYHNAKNAGKYGVKVRSVDFDYRQVKAWKDSRVHNTGTHEGTKAYKRAGVDVHKGRAHFLDKWTVSIGKKRFTASKFLIATGTYNVIPPIEGLKQTGFITYKEAIDLEKLPKSIFIIGGGAIGCEFAQIFNTFGVRVHIAEFMDHLLPKEDTEVGALVGQLFEREKIHVHTTTKVIEVKATTKGKEVIYIEGGKTRRATVEEVLLATGKGAMTDMGLENAGVKYSQRSIPTNKRMQTSAAHIYAAGDVTGPYMFTHMASYQSRIAAHNMWSRKKREADYHAVPRCVFVTPEAASVGLTESELNDKNIEYQKALVPIGVVGRSNTSDQSDGFVKVLASHNGVILGASIVAPRAGEMIHELTLACQLGLKAHQIEQTIHAFPTWSQAVRSACARIISF
ncbi:MAG: dihydrolipoyl dehydrogenase [Patescibacteria group bacterium]